MSRIWVSRAGALAALAAAIVSCGKAPSKQEDVATPAPVEMVRVADVPEIRRAAGTVRAALSSQLASKVVGNVTRVLVTEGDRVTRGQLLAEIDARDASAMRGRTVAGGRETDEAIAAASAAIAAAEANAALAHATYERFAALYVRGSASAQELDEATARQKGAAAELDRAKRAREQLFARRDEMRAALAQADAYVSETRIVAPFDGVVTVRYVDPGAQTAPGMPLLAIDSGAQLRVETTVDEEWIARLRRGDAATIRFADGSTTRATISAIVTAVDPLSRAGLVTIDLPADAAVSSGAYASVEIEVGRRSAIAVPAAAVLQRGQLTSVFVVDRESVARLRLITLGDFLGDRVEVLSGLDEGERIVSRTTKDLRDGTRIRVVTSLAGASR